MRAHLRIALLAVPLALAHALICAGCALTQKADSVLFRYFSPELSSAVAPPSGESVVRGLELRIGRVDSAAYIKDRLVYREDSQEVHYYDPLRWSEKPEAFLRRAIRRALFEQRGLRELVSRSGPTLEMELDTLDELRGKTPLARVRITWVLRDEQAVLIQRTLVVERPVGSTKSPPPPEEVASALAAALAEAVRGVATEVVAELQRAH